MTDIHQPEILSLGSDSGRGNLLGVQPYLLTTDYASAEAFYARLDSYLQAARQLGWLGGKTVVVWPELIGAWLVAAGESPRVFQAHKISEAMRPLVFRHLFPFLGKLIQAREKERVIASLFRLKARAIADLYQAAFARLARQYRVTVVAGSVFLPAARVQDGRVVMDDLAAPLYNTSVVFAPDGQAHPQVVRKCFPIASELGFVACGSVDDLPIFDTSAGKLGVLICADSWYLQAYQHLKARGAELVAVPSLAAGAGIWEKPWGGYDGDRRPADVDPADQGRLTEAQAWAKYALRGRFTASGARGGVNVFLHGALWDLGTDAGNSLAVRRVAGAGAASADDMATEARKNGSALLNVWL